MANQSKVVVDQITGNTNPLIVTAPTPPLGDSSNRVATTAFVASSITGQWGTNGNAIYNLNTNGNVGIGTSNPLNNSGSGGLEVATTLQVDGSLTLPNTPLALAYGGTGLNAVGAADTLLGVVDAGGSLEYKTLTSTSGTIGYTYSAGSVSIDLIKNTLPNPIEVQVNNTNIGQEGVVNLESSGSITLAGSVDTVTGIVTVEVNPIPTFRRAFLLKGG